MKYLLYCVFFFWGFLLFSQNKEVLYGLDETPQALLLNPGARVSNSLHFGIPLISHLHFNGGSSGVSAYDIFQKSSIDINTRISKYDIRIGRPRFFYSDTTVRNFKFWLEK